MADDYIDYLECREYGNHFCNEAKNLIGASALGDIGALITHLQSHIGAVTTELGKQGIEKSGTRVNRQEAEAKSSALRAQITKFHHYLSSLDDNIPFDMEAFFKKGMLGDIAKQKPADLIEKAAQILRGFEAPGNSALPEADKWKTKLQAAEDQLSTATLGKSTHSGQHIRATKELIAARQAFLKAYNRVAKPIVRAVLVSLEREHEMPLYFKDLAVNEEAAGKESNPPANPAEPAQPG